MAWGLRDDIRFCVIGSRVVFMDMSSERYFGLPASLDYAFQKLLDPAPLSASEEMALRPLIDRGLLVPDGRGAQPTKPICAPDAALDLIHSLPERASPSAVALALWSETVIVFASRRLSLRAIEAKLHKWRGRRADGCDQQDAMPQSYLELAAAFERTALLFHPADRCLTKALAFVLACRSRGLYPSLVFGVRTSPFAAHCWVQHETLILNDELERVRIFTPILVL